MDKKQLVLEQVAYEMYADLVGRRGLIIPRRRHDSAYCKIASTIEFINTDALFKALEEDLPLMRYIRIVGHESITMAKERFMEDRKKSWQFSKKLAFYRPSVDVEYEGAGRSQHETLYFRMNSGSFFCVRIFLGPNNLANYSLASPDMETQSEFYVHGIY
jgi:hypothetical protein